ncbi:SEFIR domain-containing protein [Streptomyces sp. SLBN-31]|uniref:SEFIR domain-containing protein n=1 Tax=Streptomyces sp. SLBN-31 TaxID=2768444 RepID=UPI001357DD00|nr:TIR domain-containing protein [Streptomyces sp. SLBN-31]
MSHDFVTSFAAVEHFAYAAQFHQDLAAAVGRRRGHAIHAAMCRGGEGKANRPLVAEARVLVALCSEAYYKDPDCGADWAVFERRLHLVAPRLRPSDSPARVLVRWRTAVAPPGVPFAPILSGEATDSYACTGLYGIIFAEGFGAAYRQAVDGIAAAVCAGYESSPPVVSADELRDLVLPFPRREAGPVAKVPPQRKPAADPRRPRVFISYAHDEDDPEHRERVRSLIKLLRDHVEVRADFDAEDEPQNWARWCSEECEAADFIVMVASTPYKRRVEQKEAEGKGLGATWEGAYIWDYAHDNPKTWHRRILRVVFPEHSADDLPKFPGSTSVTRYTIDPVTGEGLLDKLLGYLTRPAI